MYLPDGSEQSLFSWGKVLGSPTQGPESLTCEDLEWKSCSADGSLGNTQVSSGPHGPHRELGGLDRNGGGEDQWGPCELRLASLSLSFVICKMEVGMSIFWGCDN